jgi:hypothetical protein
MRRTIPLCRTTLCFLLLWSALAVAQPRQPVGIKGPKVELHSDRLCDHENGQVVTQKEAGAIQALEESGRSVRIRCGNKEGWVDRQDLLYELPPASDGPRPNTGGSIRGLN